MPNLTFAHLLPRIRDCIHETDTSDGLWNDTNEILPSAIIIFQDIAARVMYPRKQVIGNLTNAHQIFTLPTDFLCMDYREKSGNEAAFRIKANNSTWVKVIPSKPSARGEANILTDAGSASTTASRYWFEIENDGTTLTTRRVQLCPKHTGTASTNGYIIDYICLPTPLTASTGNELIDLYHQEAVYGTAWMLWGKAQNGEMMNYYWQLYQSMLPPVALSEHERMQIGARVIPLKVKQIGG